MPDPVKVSAATELLQRNLNPGVVREEQILATADAGTSYAGVTGVTGPTGPQGRGPTGPTGVTGATGP